MLDMSVHTETPGKSGFLVCYKHWRLPVDEVRERESAAAKAMIADAYQCRRTGRRPMCTCIGGDGLRCVRAHQQVGPTGIGGKVPHGGGVIADHQPT